MERQQTVAAVVLAAGESRRFGGAKQLAELDGRTLLEHVLALADEAGLAPIVAVVPVWLTRPRAMDDERLRWVRNPYPERGMSHSLRLGFEALGADAEAAVILLGDQPTVPPAAIAALLAARGEKPIVATMTGGTPGAAGAHRAQPLRRGAAAGGDIGLREVLNDHPEWVAAIELPAPIPDVDTVADLRALEARE